jgi:hypothetical protein
LLPTPSAADSLLAVPFCCTHAVERSLGVDWVRPQCSTRGYVHVHARP